MAKRIERNQVIADGIFDDFIKGAQKTLETGDKVKQKLTEMLAVSKEFFMTWRSFDAKGIRDFNAAMRDSSTVLKQLEQLKKEQARTQEALNKALAANEKLQREVLKTEEQRAKSTKRQAEEQRKANSVYEQTKKRLNEVKRELKELEITGKGATKQAHSLREELLKLDTQVRKAEYSVGEFQRNVGNYPNTLGKAEKAVRGFGNTVMSILGIGGGFALFKNAVMNIAEFEQSLADLRAILGLTADSPEFEYLQEQALKLGTTTMASAVEVVEAYKLIGSAQPELLENVSALNKVTEAALTLSDASGLALPEAATALTDAMNQFGASADQAARYINTLAAGAKFGSAEVPQVTEALLKFGVAAKSSNISIEESVGLIEAFAERGLKGAEAGTALRNILLKLSAAKALPKEALNQLRQAGVDIDKLSNNSLSLSERLEELAKIQGNSTAITKTFGIENAVAAQTLIENRKRVDELTASVTNTNTAQEQAAERTDTVNGELKKLANTWQATIIKFGQGGGSLKSTIKFLRENLETIVEVVINATQAFLTYKAAVMAVNVAYKTKDIVNYITNLGKVKQSIQAATVVTKEQEAAQIAANRAMKANVIGLVASGLVTLIDQLDLFKSAADLAAESQERINSAMEKNVSILSEYDAAYRQRLDQINEEYKLKIRAAKTDEERAKLETEMASRLKGEFQAQNSRIIETNNGIRKQITNLQELAEKYSALANVSNQQTEGLGLSKDGLNLNERIKALEATLEQSQKAVKSLRNEQLNAQLDAQDAINATFEEQSNLTKAQADALKKAKDDAYNEQLREIERVKTLEETAILRTTESEESKNDKKLNIEKEFLEKKLALDKLYNKDFEKTELELVQKKIEIENNEIERKRKLDEKLAEIQRLVDEQEIKNTEDKFERERLLALNDFEQRLAQLEKEGKLTQELEVAMKKELIKKLNAIDEEENESNFNDDLKNYQDYYKFRELELLKSGKSESEIEAQLHKDKIEFLKDEIALRQEYGKDTMDQEIELARLQNENQQKRLEDIKEFSSRAIELAEQEIQRQNDLRNQAADKEIEKRESAIDRQRELAEKGLDNTLAFEEAKLAQAELEKARLAKKELRDQQKITFLKLLQGYATEGKASEAVRRALTDIALAQVIQGSFYEGTEHIGDSLGTPSLPGRDGYIIRADKDEAILTGKQNKKRGMLSNDELVDVGHKFLSGDLVPRELTPTITIPGRSSELLASADLSKKMDKLYDGIRGVQAEIKNKPVYRDSFDSIGNLIREEFKAGMLNKTTYPRRRSRI